MTAGRAAVRDVAARSSRADAGVGAGIGAGVGVSADGGGR